MLRSLQSMLGYCAQAQDGHIGSIVDFLFNEETWRIDYIGLRVGIWKTQKSLAISIDYVSGHSVWSERKLPLSLSMEELEKLPQYRHIEREPWAIEVLPNSTSNNSHNAEAQTITESKMQRRSLFRSFCRLRGLHLLTDNKDSGCVIDLIIDDQSWQIQEVVVRVGWRIFLANQVLIPIKRIHSIRWGNRALIFSGTREELCLSPSFKAEEPVNKEICTRLYDYYGRPRDWEERRGQSFPSY